MQGKDEGDRNVKGDFLKRRSGLGVMLALTWLMAGSAKAEEGNHGVLFVHGALTEGLAGWIWPRHTRTLGWGSDDGQPGQRRGSHSAGRFPASSERLPARGGGNAGSTPGQPGLGCLPAGCDGEFQCACGCG